MNIEYIYVKEREPNGIKPIFFSSTRFVTCTLARINNLYLAQQGYFYFKNLSEIWACSQNLWGRSPCLGLTASVKITVASHRNVYLGEEEKARLVEVTVSQDYEMKTVAENGGGEKR